MIPHLDIPFRLSPTGGFAVVDQDSNVDVANCVAAVLATPVGSRVEVPEFGIPSPEFVGPDIDAMVAGVAEWEPRADVDVAVLVAATTQETLTQVTATLRPHV